jgi:uncharacterized OsmC-like protein
MTARTIKDALGRATAYLGEHPDEARYRDGPAVASLRAGLAVDITGSGGEAAATDMAPSVGGGGSAPSPGWLFRAAAASCVATLVAMRAAELDIAIERLEVSVDSESDDLGILGIDPSVPAGPLNVRVAVTLEAAGFAAPELRDLVAWAVDHCPVTDAIRRAVPLEVVVAA